MQSKKATWVLAEIRTELDKAFDLRELARQEDRADYNGEGQAEEAAYQDGKVTAYRLVQYLMARQGWK
jgi:hypothetical protein